MSAKPEFPIGRRQFFRTATAAAAPAFIASRRTPPSARITLGVVGLGSRGFNLVTSFLGHDDAQIVAICDVDSHHYRDKPWGEGKAFGREPAKTRLDAHYGAQSGVKVTRDFREICAGSDIDAVVVATPDHWHALCTLEALRNGKDVYCEKPLTHTFHEGQLVYREVTKQKAVFQTGSQQRSDSRFRRAVELVRNGHLGKLKRIEVGLPPGYDRPQGDTAITKPPPQLDYDWWCGPAPVLPYMRARHHRWWRGHRAYGGGVLMDFIGHHNDIAHWALGENVAGPSRVEAVHWVFPKTKVYDTPQHYEIRCEYPGGISSSISNRNKIGTKLIGENGWIYVNRAVLETSDPAWADARFQPGSKDVYLSNDHTRNFLDCVKSRRQCIAPAEAAHRSITPGHLGYVSHALSRPLRWDPDKEMVIGDNQANLLLHRHEYREPWTTLLS